MTRRLDPREHNWMTTPQARAVMEALGEARFVGGAVRNALLGQPVHEVDIATPLTPDAVAKRLEAAGLRAVPTGIEHGTVTAISGGTPFEITSLRRDVATDGRRATVAFTNDWAKDAARRDFTMNALYAKADGEIFDYASGIADLERGHVRFMGEPVTRVREDYLRILRLFRFHAWYGKDGMNAAALEAATAEKGGLNRLSGERIQKEILRLLEAVDPLHALHVMAERRMLDEFMPAELNLTRLEKLVAIDRASGFEPAPVLRLAALLKNKNDAAAIAERFRLSNKDRARLEEAADSIPAITADLSDAAARALIYRLGPARFRDQILLYWAKDADISHATHWSHLLALSKEWQSPHFPLSGRDVLDAGVAPGGEVGRILKEIEAWWIEQDFPADRTALEAKLKAAISANSRSV